MQNADELGLDVGHTVERIEQQPARSLVQRQRHGVDGEVAPTKVLMNRGRSNDGRFAGFFMMLGPRHGDFGASVAGQGDKKRTDVFFDRRDLGAGFFEFLVQFEGIALNGEIEVADGAAANDVADGPTSEVEIQTGGAATAAVPPSPAPSSNQRIEKIRQALKIADWFLQQLEEQKQAPK